MSKKHTRAHQNATSAKCRPAALSAASSVFSSCAALLTAAFAAASAVEATCCATERFAAVRFTAAVFFLFLFALASLFFAARALSYSRRAEACVRISTAALKSVHWPPAWEACWEHGGLRVELAGATGPCHQPMPSAHTLANICAHTTVVRGCVQRGHLFCHVRAVAATSAWSRINVSRRTK